MGYGIGQTQVPALALALLLCDIGPVVRYPSASVSSFTKWGQTSRTCSLLGLTVSETKQALFSSIDMLTMVGDTANKQGHLR